MIKLPKHKNADLKLNIKNDEDIPHITKLCDALSNDTRIKILKILQNPPYQITIINLMKQLDIPKTTLMHHLNKLEDACIISMYYYTENNKTIRVIGRDLKSLNINIYYNQNEKEETILNHSQIIRVGQFSDFTGKSFSFATKNQVYHFHNENCFCSERFDSELIYTHSGIITYHFSNGIFKTNKVISLNFSFEICSEAPYYDNHYKSDITFWINDIELLTYTLDGDFGDRRGILNPNWWPNVNTQYGKLLNLKITKNGIEINGNIVNKKYNIDNLNLVQTNKIKFSFGNKNTSEHIGGFNLFGKSFGDYAQDIILEYSYLSNKIE